MDLTFQATIQEPSTMTFGGVPLGGAKSDVLVTVHNADTQLAAFLPGSSTPVHLTTAQLRAQYTDAELLAAIQAPKA